MSSWTDSYEKLMRIDGHEPYGCLYEQCNHIARGTFGMLLHGRFGAHHLSHRRKRKS